MALLRLLLERPRALVIGFDDLLSTGADAATAIVYPGQW